LEKLESSLSDGAESAPSSLNPPANFTLEWPKYWKAPRSHGSLHIDQMHEYLEIELDPASEEFKKVCTLTNSNIGDHQVLVVLMIIINFAKGKVRQHKWSRPGRI
jgi:hypothetical protein